MTEEGIERIDSMAKPD